LIKSVETHLSAKWHGKCLDLLDTLIEKHWSNSARKLS